MRTLDLEGFGFKEYTACYSDHPLIYAFTIFIQVNHNVEELTVNTWLNADMYVNK